MNAKTQRSWAVAAPCSINTGMGNIDLVELGFKASIFWGPLLFALCFHEYAHGWVARLKGDNTAQLMGRLTMNPFAHMDLIGTVILPMAAILFSFPVFGYAKPVPVNSRNLRNPTNDMFWIAIAGPLSNIVLAFVGWLLVVGLVGVAPSLDSGRALLSMAQYFILINLILAAFNMLPLHPLDGGKVLARFLPDSVNRRLEENQHLTTMILLMLLFTGGLGLIFGPISFLSDSLFQSALSTGQMLF